MKKTILYFVAALAILATASCQKENGKDQKVGGKSKDQKQIKDVKNAFIVKDDIENAYQNILPLWFFGMNY